MVMTSHPEWDREGRSSALRIAVIGEGDPLAPCPSLLRALAATGRPGGHQVDLIQQGPGHARARLATGDYDLIHLSDLGDAALAAAPQARASGLPLVATYDPYGADELACAVLSDADAVLSPSPAADRQLAALGVPATRLRRWLPGVDPGQFHPARYAPEAFGACEPGACHLLLPWHGDVVLLERVVESFLAAFQRDPRLRLVIVGEVPVPARLRLRLGAACWTGGGEDRDRLARNYASADLLLAPAAEDAFGESILAAQASGLPVLAQPGGAAQELIESGRSGLLIDFEDDCWSDAIVWLARRATLRERLATGGLLAMRGRTWEQALARLGELWATVASAPAEVVYAA